MNGRIRGGLRARIRTFAPIAAALLLVLPLLAGCGDDDNNSAARTTATAPIAATSTPALTATATVSLTATAEPPTSTSGAPTTTTPSSPAATATAPGATASATPQGETITLAVYFIRDERIATARRTLPRTQQVAQAAMEQLLAGPTEAEAEAGLSSSVPEGTEYLGVTIDQGLATVNLSSEFESGGGSFSMMARLAQVVYTLTQFPTIDFVQFELDGEPVTVFGGEGIVMDRPVGRKNYEELTPAIFVASPAIFDEVESPLRVTGTANTFEAAFMLQILAADGTVLVEEPMMATSGTGTRGTFDATIEFNAQPGSEITLRVFEQSARDGSDVNVVEIPLVVRDEG